MLWFLCVINDGTFVIDLMFDYNFCYESYVFVCYVCIASTISFLLIV